jgi:hypothetical protein
MPTPQGQPGKCSNQQACEAAAYIAESNQSLVGTSTAPGVTVRGIQAVGSTVVMDMRIQESASALGVGVDPRLDALMKGFMSDATALGVCTPDPAGMTFQPFLDVGGKIRLRVISSDGVVVSDSTVTSCRGVR